MHPNEQLIETFYTAFAAKDYAAMQACYAPQVTIKSRPFQRLALVQPGARPDGHAAGLDPAGAQ